MSAYKVVTGDVALIDQNCIIQVLEAMGMQVQTNAICEQRWTNHNQRADLVVKQRELPEYLQGFGDLGLIKTDGKYAFLTISEQDSWYIDSSKRRELRQKGMNAEEANDVQPDGKFQKDQAEFLHVIETGYAGLELAQSILERCDGATFDAPTGVEGNSNAWMMQGSVSASDLQKMGVTVGV